MTDSQTPNRAAGAELLDALDPEEVEIQGIAADAAGRLVVAYRVSEGQGRLAGIGRDGTLAWEWNEIPFSDDARLLASPGGDVLVVSDRNDRGADQAIILDGRDRTLLGHLVGPGNDEPSDEQSNPATLRPFCVGRTDVGTVAVDPDRTLLVYRHYSGCPTPVLARFRFDGTPVPVWPSVPPPPKPGFFARTFGTVRKPELWVQPEWGKLRDTPLLLPDGEHRLAFGPDGSLYVFEEDLKRLAVFDRRGSLVRETELPAPDGIEIYSPEAVAVDAKGVPWVLVEVHRKPMPDGSRPGDEEEYDAVSVAILRIPSGRRPELWIGAFSPHPATIDEGDDLLAAGPDGTLFVSGMHTGSLRRFDREGNTAWISPTTVRADEEAVRIAERLRARDKDNG